MSDPHKIADALLAAERTRTPIQPFTRNNPFLDTAVGYAAQESLIEQKCAAGEWSSGSNWA